MANVRCVTTAIGRPRRWVVLALAGAALASAAAVPGAAEAAEGSADLSVAVAHTGAAFVTGDAVTLTVTGTNGGPDPAAGVVLGVSLGYPLRFVEADERCEVVSYDTTSVLCDVGSVAPGSSVAVDITVRAEAAGVYTVPAAASSTTADPDAGDLSAADTFLVRRGPLQGERYVRGEFPGVFGRTPDAATVAFWAARFTAGRDQYPSRLVDVPTGWLNSGEYRRLRIREAYTRILGRAAGAGDVATWTNQLNKGMSYGRLDQQLILSLEFRNARPARGAFAAGVYQVVLGRAPTAAEAAAAQRALAGGRRMGEFVQGLQRSTEGFDVLIRQRYQSAVGRAPDAFGRYVWQSELRKGATVEQLYARLLVGNEVLSAYPRTTDDYPYYEEEYDGRDAGSGLPSYDFRD